MSEFIPEFGDDRDDWADPEDETCPHGYMDPLDCMQCELGLDNL